MNYWEDLSLAKNQDLEHEPFLLSFFLPFVNSKVEKLVEKRCQEGDQPVLINMGGQGAAEWVVCLLGKSLVNVQDEFIDL